MERRSLKLSCNDRISAGAGGEIVSEEEQARGEIVSE